MQILVDELRGMTNTAPADYSIGSISYWNDDQIQTILDRNRKYQNQLPLEAVLTIAPGNLPSYTLYKTCMRKWESGAEVLDYNAAVVSSTLYTFAPDIGEITFLADQKAAYYTLRGYTYDMNAAAGQVWRQKAAHYASAYDVSTDNHNLKRSQLIIQAREMAAMYEGMSGSNVIYAERGDM
jgi:hypothetical protein